VVPAGVLATVHNGPLGCLGVGWHISHSPKATEWWSLENINFGTRAMTAMVSACDGLIDS
jgi:hypothetical protein